MSLRRSEEWPELGGHRGAKPAVGGGHLMHRVPQVDNTLSIIQHHPFTHLARGSPRQGILPQYQSSDTICQLNQLFSNGEEQCCLGSPENPDSTLFLELEVVLEAGRARLLIRELGAGADQRCFADNGSERSLGKRQTRCGQG